MNINYPMGRKGLVSVIFGIIFFVIRYIPAIHQKDSLIDKWFSVFEYSSSCSLTVEVVMQNCGIIKAINIVLIIFAAIFFFHGLYELIKRD